MKTQHLISKHKTLNFKKIIVITIIALYSQNYFAQTDTKNNIREKAIKVFLDCDFCDLQHIKKEIDFVNYVRDSKEAQVHILVSNQSAGNGGKEYSFIFMGQKDFAEKDDTLSFVSTADNTSDEIRNKQIKKLKLGLMPYIIHTPLSEYIDIDYTKVELKEEVVKDKWNSWVFKIGVDSWLRGESNYKSSNVMTNIQAQKITPEWKHEIDLFADFDNTEFIVGEDVYSNKNKSKSFEFLVVKSLGEHWSFGGILGAGSSTYNNYKLFYRLYPAIEYNIFPYSKSTLKQLRILLTTGYVYRYYNDMTLYDKTEEGLFRENIEIAYQVKQKWGTINSSFTGSVFLHDLTKNRIGLNTSLNIRILKGLTFNVRGQYYLIHDQLNLPKEGASLEETLLRQQQLATQYIYWGSVGISYTFGSIYNNVVNPRFGN